MSEEETAIPVHCFAHCLNLCLQDSAKKCECIRNALDLVFESMPAYKLFTKKIFNLSAVQGGTFYN